MILDTLREFSITKENINKITFLDLEITKKSKKVIKPDRNYSFFITDLKDSLFWYFYIFINGHEQFKTIKSNFLEEKAIKIALIQKVRENKPLMKKMKIKRTEVEDELLNQQTIKTKTFLLLCAIEKINIIIKDQNKYVECINNVENTDIQVIEKTHNKYGLYIYDKEKQIELCREKLWNIKILNFDKPLRAISNYKVANLRDICDSLNITIPNKMKKKDLYQLILLKLK
jgi:hypothetical protein